MTLLSGDLTTQPRLATWVADAPNVPSNVFGQLITSMTALIYGKLNRSRLFSQPFTRVFDGAGTMQLVLPDWPVTSIGLVQIGSQLIPPARLQNPNQAPANCGYGYRAVEWNGNLPGDPTVLELIGTYFWAGAQNIRVTYTAGYLVSAEPGIVPAAGVIPANPPQIIVQQAQGIWCRDHGVTYADGTPFIPVTSGPTVGQYVPPTDTALGVYTFAPSDTGASVLITYSFIPADLEEACIQMVAERYSYRSRVGVISKSLGGQETVRFARGNMGPPWNRSSSLPPEVMDLISPYISVLPPPIGAPV